MTMVVKPLGYGRSTSIVSVSTTMDAATGKMKVEVAVPVEEPPSSAQDKTELNEKYSGEVTASNGAVKPFVCTKRVIPVRKVPERVTTQDKKEKGEE